MGYLAINQIYMKKASARSIDIQIERDTSDVDSNLELMKKIYGDKKLNEMSPGEFYTAYQKFAQNQLKSDASLSI